MNKIRPVCHVCSNLSDFLFHKDGFDEYICKSCGLSFVHPQPDVNWLKEKVYSYESGYQGNKTKDLSQRPLDKRVQRALDFLIKNKVSGNLLDVGCSNGQFMYWARNSGFNCSGVEINKRTADMAIANGFPVFNGFLENCNFKKNHFDILYAGDVIEHVNSPRNFILTCESFIKENGLIAFSTPNVDCWWSNTTLRLYKIFKIPWSSATPPHHLFQFSHNNLNILMEEKGFRPVFKTFTGPSNLRYELGSLHLYREWKMSRTFGSMLFMLFSYTMYTVVFTLSKILGLFLKKKFEMVVVYKKS